MPARGAAIALSAMSLVSILVSGCIPQPFELGSSYAPQHPPIVDPNRRRNDRRRTCLVNLSAIDDARQDRQSAGDLGGRPVRASDAVAWLRSGLLAMSGDDRTDLTVQPSVSPADLSIHVELLKVYLLQVNEAKSANVAVRVHYDRGRGGPKDVVYRGSLTGLDWANGGDEAQGALDSALEDLLNQLDRDVLSECAATGSPG